MGKIKITLDPGHSKNYNRGAVAPYYESNAMYDLSLYLKDALEKYGIFEVFTTKPVLDCCPSLTARGNAAIKNGSRVLLSLHSNGCNGTAKGVTAFISSFRQSEAFANTLCQAVSDLFNKYGSTGTYNRKAVKRLGSSGRDYYGLIRNAVTSYGVEHPILIENGFHDNVDECTVLNKTGFLEELADVLAAKIYDQMKAAYVSDTCPTIKGVTTTSVNIRTGGSTGAQILYTAPKGTTLKVISVDGGWARIEWNGAMAFVSAQYVSGINKAPSYDAVKAKNSLPKITSTTVTMDDVDKVAAAVTPSDPLASMNSLGTGYVTATELNVRSGPATKYNSYGCLRQNDRVEVFIDSACVDTEWYRVNDITVNGKKITAGYVHRHYITVDGASARIARVTAEVAVRSGPGTKYTKVNTAPKGKAFYVIPDYDPTDGWARVMELDDYIDTVNGWTNASVMNTMFIEEKYLVYSADEVVAGNLEEALQSCKMPFGTATTTTALNVRSGPGASYSKITTLAKGATVVMTGHYGNGWAQIMYKGQIEYVNESYLKIVNDIGKKFENIDIDEATLALVKKLPEVSAVEWLSEVLKGRLTSPFGKRIHPITKVESFHNGVDIGANGGTPILATTDGFVIGNAYDANGYGNYLVILASDGTRHYYAHMKSRSALAVGTMVHAGMKIGYVGTTGASTGNHLHYEIRDMDNTRRNPATYQFNKSLIIDTLNAMSDSASPDIA